MNTAACLGRRPIVSRDTDPLAEQIHPEALALHRRVWHALGRRLVQTLPPGIGFYDTGLMVCQRLGFIPPFLAQRSSPAALDKALGEALTSSWSRRTQLQTLLASGQPTTLPAARACFRLARQTGPDAERDLVRAMREGGAGRFPPAERDAQLRWLQDSSVPALLAQVRLLDAARQRPDFDPAAFADVLRGGGITNGDPGGLQQAVDKAGDIVLIDILLECGARLGRRDSQGRTEIGMAVDHGDYYLAAKLRLALNYQTTREQGPEERSRCALACYQFDEASMTVERAAYCFFQILSRHQIPFTHGLLLYSRKDGQVATRVVHMPCAPDEQMEVTTMGDTLLPRCKAWLSSVVEERRRLTRRSLHGHGLSSASCRPGQRLDQAMASYWNSATGRLFWGGWMGCLYAGLSYTVDRIPHCATLASISAAWLNLLHSTDPVVNTAVRVGQCLGGLGGLMYGAPVMGAQLGGLTVRSLKELGKLGMSTAVVDAVGTAYRRSDQAMGAFLLAGGALCLSSAVGDLRLVSADVLRRFYEVVGLTLSASAFLAAWESPRFRYLVCALLASCGLSAGVLALYSPSTLFAAAGGLYLTGSELTGTPGVVTLVNLVGGVLYLCDWEGRKLRSVMSGTGDLLAQGIDWIHQQLAERRNPGAGERERDEAVRLVASFRGPEPLRLTLPEEPVGHAGPGAVQAEQAAGGADVSGGVCGRKRQPPCEDATSFIAEDTGSGGSSGEMTGEMDASGNKALSAAHPAHTRDAQQLFPRPKKRRLA